MLLSFGEPASGLDSIGVKERDQLSLSLAITNKGWVINIDMIDREE